MISDFAVRWTARLTSVPHALQGSEAIVQEYSARILESDGKKCYPIPCGGSNALVLS